MKDEDGYLQRAYAAWYRSGGRDVPANDSSVLTHEGKDYVVLKNANGVLAVYRIKKDGLLRRLRRWPEEIET
jgi:hypothetical protein